jgi:hypothetical protein
VNEDAGCVGAAVGPTEPERVLQATQTSSIVRRTKRRRWATRRESYAEGSKKVPRTFPGLSQGYRTTPDREPASLGSGPLTGDGSNGWR